MFSSVRIAINCPSSEHFKSVISLMLSSLDYSKHFNCFQSAFFMSAWTKFPPEISTFVKIEFRRSALKNSQPDKLILASLMYERSFSEKLNDMRFKRYAAFDPQI